MKNRFMTYLTQALLIGGLSLGVAACSENDAEEAGEEIDQMVDDAGDAIDDAADDAGNAIEDACENVKEGVDAEDTDC